MFAYLIFKDGRDLVYIPEQGAICHAGNREALKRFLGPSPDFRDGKPKLISTSKSRPGSISR